MKHSLERVVIIGATSAIAQATARELAAAGAQLFLAGRDTDKLQAVAEDLRGRGAAAVYCGRFDALDEAAHAAVLAEADARLDEFDTVLIAHGVLPDQADCARDVAASLAAFSVNATSVMSLAALAANTLEARGRGVLAVLSSVAGDRGRQSNYVYGAAKASVSTFFQGLRQRLHPSGVAVVTIKPGPVDTPMTRGLPKGPLLAAPERVATDIVRGLRAGRATVYTPWFWRYIMWVIRLLPDVIYRRLPL